MNPISPISTLIPLPGQVPPPTQTSIDANFATDLLFLEALNDPFFSLPLLGIGSDQLALLEAEEEGLEQATFATDLGANVNGGVGTNVIPGPGTNVNPGPGTNPSPGPNVNARPGTNLNMVV